MDEVTVIKTTTPQKVLDSLCDESPERAVWQKFVDAGKALAENQKDES